MPAPQLGLQLGLWRLPALHEARVDEDLTLWKRIPN
jgi:hypothetical protein